MIGYEDRIRNRSLFRFLMGLIPRTFYYLKFSLWRRIAIIRGAKIGKYTVITRTLALKANHNLIIGSNCSIASKGLDLRGKWNIGNYVIIRPGTKIILASHDHTSPYFETYYTKLKIEDYAWLGTDCTVLPKTTKIGYGAILGTRSVVAKPVDDMNIMVGNPAKSIRKRQCVHDKMPVESLRGFDLLKYIKTYLSK